MCSLADNDRFFSSSNAGSFPFDRCRLPCINYLTFKESQSSRSVRDDSKVASRHLFCSQFYPFQFIHRSWSKVTGKVDGMVGKQKCC